jgi:hypothetical protein
MQPCPEDLIGAAKLYEAALIARGATSTDDEWATATIAVAKARRELVAAVIDLAAVVWLAHLDD